MNTVDYIAPLRELHHTRIEPVTGPPVGASDAEIEELEKHFGSLPIAYKQFLAWMGRDYHGIYRGTDIFVTNVVDNTAGLPDLLRENGIEPPAYDYLCFLSHQGYFMAWFQLPASDNPPIFFFGEGQDMHEPKKHGSFADYILWKLTDLAEIGGSARSAPKPGLISRISRMFRKPGNNT